MDEKKLTSQDIKVLDLKQSAEETSQGRVESIEGNEYWATPITIINTKDSPVMNGVMYPATCLKATDWEHCRLTLNHPDWIMDVAKVCIGFIVMAKYNEKKGTLEAIAYISKKCCDLVGVSGLYEKLKKGEAMDVSCAVMLKEEQGGQGVSDTGDKYNTVALSLEPIAVGILENQKGACSQPYCKVNQLDDTPADDGEPATMGWVKDVIAKYFTNTNQEETEMKPKQNCETMEAVTEALNSDEFKSQLSDIVGAAIDSKVEAKVNAALAKNKGEQNTDDEKPKGGDESVMKAILNKLEEVSAEIKDVKEETSKLQKNSIIADDNSSGRTQLGDDGAAKSEGK